VEKSLKIAKREGHIKSEGEFWGTDEQFANVPIRDRSNESTPTTNAENISPMEIIACIDLIEKHSGRVEKDELIRVVAKTLGFKRAGPDFQTHVKRCLSKIGR
jgi:hypothetical protein